MSRIALVLILASGCWTAAEAPSSVAWSVRFDEQAIEAQDCQLDVLVGTPEIEDALRAWTATRLGIPVARVALGYRFERADHTDSVLQQVMVNGDAKPGMSVRTWALHGKPGMVLVERQDEVDGPFRIVDALTSRRPDDSSADYCIEQIGNRRLRIRPLRPMHVIL